MAVDLHWASGAVRLMSRNRALPLRCAMGARCASLPRADADPVILLDLPVVCPSGRLTGYVKSPREDLRQEELTSPIPARRNRVQC
jgi:hypothetical protein